MARTGDMRIEHDLLGDGGLPVSADCGIQTLRAPENFPISGITIRRYPALVRALALIKLAAVKANADHRLIDGRKAGAVARACQKIASGVLLKHFAVDVIQGGAGNLDGGLELHRCQLAQPTGTLSI